MKIKYSLHPLASNKDWQQLGKALGDGRLEVVINILRHLRAVGAKCYFLEDPYIDRDYSADYQYFYARTFRSRRRHCKRIHFFSEDISPLLRRPLFTKRLSEISECLMQAYRGFCVVRPLSRASIGRTVLLSHVPSRFDMEPKVTCRAEFNANLAGIDLQVTGTSFLQQDSRVGACAQVAIWAGMRHMHARYNYNWVSVADITRFARPPTVTESFSLPPASGVLSSDTMVRAITAAGYQPLCFRGTGLDIAILPYVESGIPVILGLNLDGTVGHAVTVVGRVFARQTTPTNRAIDYVPAYIVHDDQAGPFMWLSMHAQASTQFKFSDDTIKRLTSTGTIVELDVRTHAVFAVALMSPRVFSTAEAAECSSRDRIHAALHDMPATRQVLRERDLPVNERLLNELQSAYSSNQIVLRTYLTSAAGYRRHLAAGSASDDLKDSLLDLHLPHFSWITEISTIDACNQASPALRRIYGHTVVDATSTGQSNGLLVLHLPGLLFTNDVNVRPPKQQLTIIADDKLYECREKQH